MGIVKIGVIGTGNMGRNHVRILHEENNRFDLVGIYDTNIHHAKTLADIYGITAFDTLEQLLEQVDAVVIAVPSSLHRAIGLKVAKMHKHALIEKPIALTGEQGEELSKAYDEANCVLTVGHVERFNPAIVQLKKILGNEKIIGIEAKRYGSFDGRIADANVVEDLMIHDIDLMNYIMKDHEVVSLKSVGRTVKSGKLDFVSTLITFDNGVYANVSASRVSQNKIREILVHTENSFIEANLLTRSLMVYRNTNMVVDEGTENSYKQDSVIQRIFVPIIEPLRAELLAFYDSITQKKPVMISGKMASNAVSICEKVIKQCEQ